MASQVQEGHEQAKLAFPKMSIRRHIDDRRRRCLIGAQIILSLFTLLLAHGAPASDMIYTGGNLTDGNTLVSAGGSFTVGFFSLPGEPSKRYLGAWFSFSPFPDAMAIYWVANRDRPLTDTSGVLVLSTTSGTLLLLDGSNNTVWNSGSTSTSSTTPPTGARLLESGNLVVVQGKNNSTAQWQLFDHPCDALLPGMKIGQNFWNGDEWFLSSWRSAADPGTGSYCYTTELGGGTPENVMWDINGTKKYRTGPWNGERFDGVPEMAAYASNFSFQVTVSPSEATYSYTARPGAPYSQLRLADDGVVQRLVWDAVSRQWNYFLREPRDDCDDYAHCGPFGLCDRNAASTSLCSCFKGFVPAFPKEWNLREYSGGCRRNVSLDCGGSSSSNQSRSSTDGFQVVPLVKLPDTQNAAVDMDASLDECRLRCLANCSCVAYAAADVTAGGGGCIIWTDSFTDLRFIEKGQDFYLRLPKSLLGGKNKKKVPVMIVVAVVVGATLVLAGIISGIVWCWRRRRVTSSSGPAEVPSPRPAMTTPSSAGHSIQYQILKDATDNFSEANKIGQGFFGTVYKCELPQGESARIGLPVGVNTVAVKVLNRPVVPNQSVRDNFEREVQVCLGLSDVNLARLLAYCNNNTDDTTEGRGCKGPILVYEYMEKGSLDRYIFGEEDKRRQLSWTQRLKIVTSVAEGVYYLHVRSNRKIVHRDLKPANILLADDFTPKIADFGLAKHVPDHPASHTPVGPYVYSAPECRNGDTTNKSDVYSFGVVLLEIISGSQNCVKLTQRLLPNPKARNSWNTNNHEAACTLRKLLDPEVPMSDEEESDPNFSSRLWRCIQIGLLCVQESPDKRPDISRVLTMLKTEGELPEPTPEEPTLPTLREEAETSNTRRSDGDDIEQNQQI